MIDQILFAGLGGGDYVHAGMRVATGVFFGISGFHKLFVPERHARLCRTLEAYGLEVG